MANRAEVRLSGNNLDNVFRQLGLSAQVTARLMGKGLSESAKIVAKDLRTAIPVGKVRYRTVRGQRVRIDPGSLRRSVRARRVTSYINGVRVTGSAAVVGYGRTRESWYARFLEGGTAQRVQRRTGRRVGRIRPRRYLARTLSQDRQRMQETMLRETRVELFRQINYAKQGDRRLDKQVLKFIG